MAKNILLIMTDQQRREYCGNRYGGIADMPNLDILSSKARFTNCTTTNPICAPARSSLITGRYPRQIGMLTMSGDLYPQIPTFMQALQKKGYKTYGVGKFHYLQTSPWSVGRGEGMELEKLRPYIKEYGYDFVWEAAGKQQLVANNCSYAKYLEDKGILDRVRDFMKNSGGSNGDTADHNYDKANPWPFDEKDYVDVVTGRVAVDKLKNHNKNKPFYMKVSFCGPHKPYDAPQRYLDMFPLEKDNNFILQDDQCLTDEQKEIIYRQRRSSKAMLKLIDDQIGEIISVLKNRNMFDETLIIFTSDHGDMLGDHFMIQKGVPWEQSIGIPLVVRLPEGKEIGDNESPVEILDIAATILDYAGLDPQESLSRNWPAYNVLIPSCSLIPILSGDKEKVRDFSFVETDFTEERVTGMTDEIRAQNRGGNGRHNAWQCIVDERYKYIKYLGYEYGKCPIEELYDLKNDPDELYNIADKEDIKNIIEESRYRLMYTLDKYPPAQKTWADKIKV